jgi:hypothetical protein
MKSDFTLLLVCAVYYVELQRFMYSVGPMAVQRWERLVPKMDGWMDGCKYRALLGAENV